MVNYRFPSRSYPNGFTSGRMGNFFLWLASGLADFCLIMAVAGYHNFRNWLAKPLIRQLIVTQRIGEKKNY